MNLTPDFTTDRCSEITLVLLNKPIFAQRKTEIVTF